MNQILDIHLGATDYLTKPVNWDELSTILNRHKIEAASQTILIVEDDEITRDMLGKAWKQMILKFVQLLMEKRH